MSWDDIKVKIKSYFEGSGFAAWTKAGDKASLATAKATQKATMLAGAVGSLDGPLGKAANGVAQLAQGFAVLGPIGASIAGLKLVIDMFAERAINKANALKEAYEKMGERVKASFKKLKAKSLEEINDQLAKATTQAAAAAARFDALASAYMKVAQAKDAVAKSEGGVKTSELTLEKSRKMLDTKDMKDKALIGADYDVRIAEQERNNTEAEQNSNVRTAKQEAEDARKRARASRITENKAKASVAKATAEYNRWDNAANSGGDKTARATADELKKKKEEAESALEKATNDRIKAVSDAEAADINVTAAEKKRVIAINNAIAAVENARNTQLELIDAQKEEARAKKEAAQKEIKAINAELKKKESDKKKADQKEKADTLTSARDSFADQFNAAFDLWRDPEAAQQAVDADKKRGEDMKAFRKAVNRYGGKVKIDEYARLMREGDEEGMQDRLTQWRKSSKFTPQVEQMVKAAAADQNKNAAEKSLAQIEKNTGDLAKKIDELLSLK